MNPDSPIHPARWVRSDLSVDRRSYVASGFFLMGIKYALEAAIVALVAHRFWSPIAFVSPAASYRADAIGDAGSALVVAFAVLSVPFLFVGLSMSVRRAVDAGLSPFFGLLFAAPVLNFVAMLVLSLRGSHERPSRHADRGADAPSVIRSAVLGIGSAVALGVAGAVVVNVVGEYGVWLFFVLPILMGAICGFEVNRRADRGIRTTLALAAGAGLATAAAFLLFGIEGAICIVMVVPIGVVTILVGALIGRQIALQSSDRLHAFSVVALLPLVATIEHAMPTPPLHHVVTTIDIAATPEQVFDEVVAFSEITAERPWYFRTGIAVPLRARIEGTGVGAVRHCEFTTGPFVEPITAWERGRRLSFDVRSSPPPMEEWSPYRHLHPPHLDSTMRSRRGEFRMRALPGGRTRLEGHTYYELGLSPDAYFAWIADALVHRIHARVLEHVARSVEARVRGGRAGIDRPVRSL